LVDYPLTPHKRTGRRIAFVIKRVRFDIVACHFFGEVGAFRVRAAVVDKVAIEPYSAAMLSRSINRVPDGSITRTPDEGGYGFFSYLYWFSHSLLMFHSMLAFAHIPKPDEPEPKGPYLLIGRAGF
jgi:hypothetical protein